MKKISSFLAHLLSITNSPSASASCATGIVVVQVTTVSVSSWVQCHALSRRQLHSTILSILFLSSALPSTVFPEPIGRDWIRIDVEFPVRVEDSIVNLISVTIYGFYLLITALTWQVGWKAFKDWFCDCLNITFTRMILIRHPSMEIRNLLWPNLKEVQVTKEWRERGRKTETEDRESTT